MLPNVTVASFVQPAKTPWPSSVSNSSEFVGIVTDVSALLHPAKARKSRYWMVGGNVKFCRFTQSWKACWPMWFTFAPNVTFVRFGSARKAMRPISVTFAPIFTLVRFAHPRKAW